MNYTNTINNTNTPLTKHGVKPLHLSAAVFFFGLPTLFMVIANYVFYPQLINHMSNFEAMIVTNAVPMAVLFAFAFGLASYENPENPQFATRLRLSPITRKHIYWGFGMFIFVMIVSGIFVAPEQALIEADVIPVPEIFPLLHTPKPDLSTDSLVQFVGGEIIGNWSVIVLYAIMITFNIMGEELWWRGYILPRQELVHGKHTWLVHGLMWCLFHAFKWWKLIGLLPVCLVISWMAQRTKSTWPGIITHVLFNIFPFVMIVISVLGV